MNTHDGKAAKATDRAVTLTVSSDIARIAIDDGRRNVMTTELLAQIHGAILQAEQEARVMLLTGRRGIFSAGFDLQVFARRDPAEIQAMMRAGAELALRLFTYPRPVISACNGHAFPMGAFLLLASDVRLGAEGDYLIGLNEVQLGIPVPQFAVELCRSRMTPAWFHRIPQGELLGPAKAAEAGFLDRVVDEVDLETAAMEVAVSLSKLHQQAFQTTKLRVRGQAAARMREAIDAEITIEHFRLMVEREGATP